MEDRKRRISPVAGGDAHAAQKRKLSSVSNVQSSALHGSEGADGISASVELDAALGLEEGFLETFRKEALHRQMLEYKRDWERISTRADRLEKDWNESHTRLLQVEQCWTALVKELRTAVGDDSEDSSMTNGHADAASPDLQLSERVRETGQLIALIAQRSSTPAPGDLVKRQELLSSELMNTRATLNHLEVLLQQSKDELDRTRAALRAAERRVDRDKSASVRKLDKNIEVKQETDQGAQSKTISQSKPASAAPSPAKDGLESPVKQQGQDEDEQQEQMRDVLEGSSGLTRSEIEELKQTAAARQEEAAALKEEKLQMRKELDDMRERCAALTEDVLRDNAPFKRMQEQCESLSSEAIKAQTELEEMRAQLDLLREAKESFRQTINKEVEDSVNKAQKTAAEQRDLATRYRSQRDEREAEMTEAKTKEAERYKHVEQMRILADSRQARITSLVSEVYRLRMQLAALEGKSDLVQQYSDSLARLQSESEGQSALSISAVVAAENESTLPETALLTSLQAKVKELEGLAQTYREQLAVLSGANEEDLDMAESLLRGEAMAKQGLEEAQKRISDMEAMLNSDGRPDIAKLSQRAKQAEETVTVLEAKVKANDMSTSMLIAEVSRLSETWEQLSKQNSNKILELAQYDLKLERLSSDKARANQKYFAAEREKEAINAQVATYSRVTASQKQAVERLQEERVQILNRLANAEKEIAAKDAAQAKLEKEMTSLERLKADASAESSTLTKQLHEARTILKERTHELHNQQEVSKTVDERLVKAEKELEKWKSKANQATAAANGQGRYVETDVKGMAEENMLLKRMLKCSSCRQKFKSHTITRCFHMFCKECIDSRLETRQRKCPSCSIAFGSQDVQQVYF